MIQEAIPGGRTQISGGDPPFTASTASQLANVLKYGSLPLSFESSEAQTVSATLGLTSLRAGLIAGAIGLLLVLVYSLLYYRVLGLLTALSLVASGAMVFAILVLLGRYINYTLDLAGIAGLIIGIGTTADSFVVFFERIKDEIREGRSFRSAVPRGWARARKTIVSGNAVTFLAAAVLYFLAIGQVKGFAFTLGLTTILDLVVVFLVTWPLVYLASKSPRLAKPAYNGLGAVQQVARERRASEVQTGPQDGTGITRWRPSQGRRIRTNKAAERRRPTPRRSNHRSQRRRCGAERRHRQTAAAPQLPLPALHRHRRVRGGRTPPALVRHQRRDRRGRDPGHPPARVHLRDRFQGRHHGVLPAVASSQVDAGGRRVQEDAGQDPESVVTVGKGSSATVQIRSETLSNEQTEKLRNALFDAFQPKGPTASPARRPSATRRYRRPGAIRSPRRR